MLKEGEARGGTHLNNRKCVSVQYCVQNYPVLRTESVSGEQNYPVLHTESSSIVCRIIIYQNYPVLPQVYSPTPTPTNYSPFPNATSADHWSYLGEGVRACKSKSTTHR